ncbi:hypothetical protein BZG36_00759 [Bifiguratus adelaidae]|uniref:Yeast cell wall synthesis Kre9/Knh1-like N-terminal domain-containing protein n=1 Tax=Bifiguratus adelaidae TaxID=1938954 RepID=A0A261Y6Y9_9FUNG|nr:hypothetical protein BZG36_00759 [Bifiguratus adelaidae]
MLPVLILALAGGALAGVAPTYPSPGTTWTPGQQYQITWTNDNTSPSTATGWTKFSIDFMTGDNDQQVTLENVAQGINGVTTSSYTWTAPQVDPPSAIYFFMFTSDTGAYHSWTTRFTITAADGSTVPPTNATQPNGQAIPWGIGKLSAATASSSTPAMVTASGVSAMPSASAVSASMPVASAASAASTVSTVSNGTAANASTPTTAPASASHSKAATQTSNTFALGGLVIALVGTFMLF